MRKYFEDQIELGATPIKEVAIDAKSRHELPQLLAGLQYIFITPELNKKIFTILSSHILEGKRQTGRLGMSLWEILVLGVMRLNLDIDYDNLHDYSNHHNTVRGILGVQDNKVFGQGKYYELQTIKDNVALLDEEILKQINTVVVQAGHQLKKKEDENEEDHILHLKSDSYVVESNIHFPTDINLLWDSARKCLDTVELARKKVGLQGWRKSRIWYKKVKRSYKKTANIHQRKGKNYKNRIKESVRSYLEISGDLNKKVKESLEILKSSVDLTSLSIVMSLEYYQKMLDKHMDLLERRIMKGEKIPHKEKVFSIFEPHVEWIKKGKANNKVELGHNTLITTDQYHFIIEHHVMIGEVDSDQPIDLYNRIKSNYGKNYKIESISFDRGFYSILAKEALQKGIPNVIMPPKGRSTQKQKEEEQDKTFQALRHQHSAVESNINELEHGGVNRVPDRGLPHFKNYIAMGVLAYNIKRLGRVVIEQNKLETLIRPCRQLRAA